MKIPVRTSAALLLAMFLIGCGQSGPLYVSGNPSSVQPVGDQATPEDDEKKEAAATDAQ